MSLQPAFRARTRSSNLTTPVSTGSDAFDFGSYLDTITATETNVVRSETEQNALKSSGVTLLHLKRAHKAEKSFLEGISSIRDTNLQLKWATMLEMIENPNKGGATEVHRVFVVCAGYPTRNKVMVANAMVVDWQLSLMKKKVKPNECPWYQPSTQGTDLRTFFGHMAKYHDWQISDVDLKGFDGALDGVLKTEFQRREKEWVSVLNRVLYIAL